ncbi:MAG: hypothetical protein WKF93_12380 [Acidimicrobiales bacterium]
MAHRLRILLTVLTVLAAGLAGGAGPAAAAPAPIALRYEVIELATLGGPSSFALDVDEGGRAVGNAAVASGRLHAVVWDRAGNPRDLGILAGSNDFSRAYAVAGGLVVGESDNDSPRAFRTTVDPGPLEQLGTLGGATAVAHGVNADGMVVGASSNGSASRPFALLAGASDPVDLGSLDGRTTTPGRAWAVSEGGAVAGVSRNTAGVGQATRWRLHNGVRGPRLGAPEALVAPIDGTGFSQGFAIDGQRRVVGEYAVGTDYRAVQWSREGTPRPLDSLGRRFARANDIAGGVTVGHVSGFYGFPTVDGRAVAWFGDQAVDLNTRIEPATGWVLRSVEGRNAAGEMVGFGTRDGQSRAFLLVPVV